MNERKMEKEYLGAWSSDFNGGKGRESQWENFDGLRLECGERMEAGHGVMSCVRKEKRDGKPVTEEEMLWERRESKP